MKTFQTLIVVKHPLSVVWSTIRDRLPEFVHLLSDIESVTCDAREEQPDGVVRLTNIWKAKATIPSVLSGLIRPEMLAWTDRAEWRSATHDCHWEIQLHFFTEHIRCAGVTRYEPALGGRGTKISFEGTLQVDVEHMGAVPQFLASTVSIGVESFVTSLIPKNFQKLAHAVSTFLDSQRQGTVGAEKI
ncbi:MAG: hypothetical protein A2V62_06920 [Nitrospirae bacterium RBG_19FT_COMBO_58_9]|nr:MAG: hypothetical protein A2V62_06920 [Nitrospirae bacterium RBG_19FT_COMBO_58_9]